MYVSPAFLSGFFQYLQRLTILNREQAQNVIQELRANSVSKPGEPSRGLRSILRKLLPANAANQALAMLPENMPNIPGYHPILQIASHPWAVSWLVHDANQKLAVAKVILADWWPEERASVLNKMVDAKAQSDYRIHTTATAECALAPVLVSPYSQGIDLIQRLDRRGPLREERALTLLRHAVKALAELNDHGRAHGRLKPTNLLIATNHRGYLMDAGHGLLSDGRHHMLT